MSPGEYKSASLGSLVVILVALGIWAVVWGPRNDAPPSGLEVDGPLFRTASGIDLGDSVDALITGEVVLVDECILLRDPEQDVMFPIIWPAGTDWDEAEEAVVLSNGSRAAIGDFVVGGGGEFRPPALSEEDPLIRRIDACSFAAEFGTDPLRFNNDADAIQIEPDGPFS